MNNRSMTTAVTTMAIGMAAGTAAYMMTRPRAHSQAKKMRKSATRALKNAGVLMNTVSDLMR